MCVCPLPCLGMVSNNCVRRFLPVCPYIHTAPCVCKVRQISAVRWKTLIYVIMQGKNDLTHCLDNTGNRGAIFASPAAGLISCFCISLCNKEHENGNRGNHAVPGLKLHICLFFFMSPALIRSDTVP